MPPMPPMARNPERRELQLNGSSCTLYGGTVDNQERPPMDRVLCTGADGGLPPFTLRLQKFWSHWSDGRLTTTLERARGRRASPPESAADAPAGVETSSIHEEWDIGRGYCRSIRWTANGQQHLAWMSSPGWASSPDAPIYAGHWHVRCEGDDPIEHFDFEAPTNRWWSSAGVVRAAMEAIEAAEQRS